MARITVNHLLEAGCHFGHRTRRWNPKMKPFVYGAKNGIHIIDLTKTMRQIAEACNFLQRVVAGGQDILFVGTKRQAQEIVRDAATRTGMYHVTERWLGGTLTNNQTIRKSIQRMQEISATLETGGEAGGSLKKKELASMARQAGKLHRNLDGIAGMRRLPGAVVIVDACHEGIAVKEARKLRIPIVALIDTNADPDQVDYPVVANDDAVKSIKVITDLFADAVASALDLYRKRVAEDEASRSAAAAQEQAAPKSRGRGRGGRERDGRDSRPASARRRAPARKAATAPAPDAPAGQAEAPAAEAQPSAAAPAKKPAARKPAAKKEPAAPSPAAESATAPAAAPAKKPAAKKPAAKKAPEA